MSLPRRLVPGKLPAPFERAGQLSLDALELKRFVFECISMMFAGRALRRLHLAVKLAEAVEFMHSQ